MHRSSSTTRTFFGTFPPFLTIDVSAVTCHSLHRNGIRFFLLRELFHRLAAAVLNCFLQNFCDGYCFKSPFHFLHNHLTKFNAIPESPVRGVFLWWRLWKPFGAQTVIARRHLSGLFLQIAVGVATLLLSLAVL